MHKVRAGIVQVLGIFIICLFMLMTIIGTYQIVTRYFFNKPSTVSEELLTYSFTWMALLASAYVFGLSLIHISTAVLPELSASCTSAAEARRLLQRWFTFSSTEPVSYTHLS